MESLLSIALSKTIGCTSDGKAVASDERIKYLNNIIKGNINNNKKIDWIINNNENDNDEENPEIEFLTCNSTGQEANVEATNWVEWINTILNSAKKIADDSEYGNIINACYNYEFSKQLKTRLLPYLPIWTGVMRSYFKKSHEIATSSSVEAKFSELKNRAFKGQLPMKTDEFAIQHLEFLDAKISLACNDKDIPVTSGDLDISDISIRDSDQNDSENVPYTVTDINLNKSNDGDENHIWNICENWHGR